MRQFTKQPAALGAGELWVEGAALWFQETLSSQTCLGKHCQVCWIPLRCYWSSWLLRGLWDVLHQPSSRTEDVVSCRVNLLSKRLVSVLWVSQSCIQSICFLLQLTASCHPLFLRARDLYSTWPCGITRNKYIPQNMTLYLVLTVHTEGNVNSTAGNLSFHL